MTENEAKKELINLSKDDKRIYAEEYIALNKAIFALEEIQKYRAIETVEELKSMKENDSFTTDELVQLACMQMYLRDYRAIGTIEEFKALKEKSVAKKPTEIIKDEIGFYHCPNPNCKRLIGTSIITRVDKYCADCGQALADY